MGDNAMVKGDKNITPEQKALLEGHNSHQYPTIQELSAANIVKDFDNTSIFDGKVTRESEKRAIVEDTAARTAETLGGAKVLLEDENTVTDEALKREIADSDGVKGWYDPKDGSVHLYMPNIESTEDAVKTVFHEKLGHEGLKALLGSDEEVMKFGQFVFDSADADIRRRILEKADDEGYSWTDPNRLSKAAQEVISNIAEDGPVDAKEYSLWRKVKNYIIGLLNKMGLRVRGLLNEDDLRYYIKKTGDKLKGKTVGDVGAVSEKGNGNHQTIESMVKTANGKEGDKNTLKARKKLEILGIDWKSATVKGEKKTGPDPVQTGDEGDIMFLRDGKHKSEENEIVKKAKADGTYMKAPNGNSTRLSEKQWGQVRTKAFKDWFGDWKLATKKVNIVGTDKNYGFKNFSEAKTWAKLHTVRSYNDDETGRKGYVFISNTSIGKFLSESAVSKSEEMYTCLC